jgi:hypothetical protein
MRAAIEMAINLSVKRWEKSQKPSSQPAPSDNQS